jgi:ATP-binding cassette subfamily B protein
MSLVPFRLLATWVQSRTVLAVGAALRRRLMRGSLQIEAQAVREKGAGQFFGLVAEIAAFESLALTGGAMALVALIELGIAALVLGWTAGPAPLLLLALTTGVAVWIALRYVVQRSAWTSERLSMTHRLIERMVGHRTRLVQERAESRHHEEDDQLERYLEIGREMDRWELRLVSLGPRAWLAGAMGVLVAAGANGLSTGYLAAALGGALLGFRALRRLTSSVSELAGAGLALRAVAPLARAAGRPVPPAPLSAGRRNGAGVVAFAKDLVFRYRPGTEPVLRSCTLRISRGARLLVEGPSGSGKTTFASVVAGLQAPDSGLLLMDGLDRSVLGAAGWRSRVAMAPQPHDNYIFSGSLAFNLLMGRRWPALDSDLVEAERVCWELGLGELLAKMPAGLFEVVGETGWQLSQGERARVFLARALLQQPDLLVLDESFSALDAENVDRAVRCVLQRASTVLAVAHT